MLVRVCVQCVISVCLRVYVCGARARVISGVYGVLSASVRAVCFCVCLVCVGVPMCMCLVGAQCVLSVCMCVCLVCA